MDLKLSRRDVERQCALAVAAAPEPVSQAAIDDAEFARHIGLKVERALWSDVGYSLEASKFERALGEVVGGAEEVTLETPNGEAIKARAWVDAVGTAHIETPKGTLIQPVAVLLGDDQGKRVAALEGWRREVMPSVAQAKKWRDIVERRPLTGDEFWELSWEHTKTPEGLRDTLQALEAFDVPTLVPTDELYWNCLLPAPAEDYAAWRDTALPAWSIELLAHAPPWKLCRAGFNAVCEAPMPAAFAENVDRDSLAALCGQEDPFSLLLALEITAARVGVDEDASARGEELLRRLVGGADEGNRRNRLFAAATIVAYAGALRSVKWRRAPLYWRRLAVLAHAGLLTNLLFQAYPDPQDFEAFAIREGGATFYLGTIHDRREAPRWSASGMSTAAVQGVVLARAFTAVESVPADKRPPTWTSLIETAMESMKATGITGLSLLPGPLSDFEGYAPPFNRKDFSRTMEDLERCVAPSGMRDLSLFLSGVALDADDLGKVERYVKALNITPEEEHAACVGTLLLAAGAATAYRHARLADAVAENGCALFPKVNRNLQWEILSAILDASNAHEAAAEGWLWVSRAFERLANRATSPGELAALAGVTGTLRRVDATSGPYFAAVEGIVRLRRPHLAVAGK